MWLVILIRPAVVCCVAILLIPKTTSATKPIRFDADIDDDIP